MFCRGAATAAAAFMRGGQGARRRTAGGPQRAERAQLCGAAQCGGHCADECGQGGTDVWVKRKRVEVL